MINEVHIEFTKSSQYAAMEDTNAERTEKISENIQVQNDVEDTEVISAFEEQGEAVIFLNDESSEDTIKL